MDQVTPFQRYLTQLGDDKAAELLKVPRRTVKSWRLGDRIPRPAQARKITVVAPVSMGDIYTSSAPTPQPSKAAA